MSSINRLHDAVKGGDLPALATLLAVDPKLSNARSETDPRGTYPLHVAAEFGQAEAAKLLLIEAGSAREQRNKHGLTPLDCASGGEQGQWQRFSNATLEDWRRCVELLRA